MTALTTYVDETGTTRPIHGVTLLNPDGSTPAAGSDASAANQTAPQAVAGADASKAMAIQGITGGKAITVSFSAAQAVTQSGVWNVGLTGTLPAFAAAPTVNLGTVGDIGTQADAAWSGTGNGTVVSVLKNIATVQTPTYLTSSTGSTIQVLSGASDNQSSGTNSLQVASRGYTFNGTGFDRQKKASSSSRIVSAAASTNATLAKSSAGDLFAIDAYNTTAAVKYLKLYNKATAPTVGTDTPVATFAIPPNGRLFKEYALGRNFSTGIAYALTGAAADADTTALTAGDVVGVNLDYQ